MSIEEYRKSDYINQSLLKEFKPWFMHGVPHKFKVKKTEETTSALNFGTILHKCLENPDNLEKVIAKPQTDLSKAKQAVMKAGYTLDAFAKNSTSKAAEAYSAGTATEAQVKELEEKVEAIKTEGSRFEQELNDLIEEGYLILDDSEYGDASYNKSLLQELVMEVESNTWVKHLREHYSTKQEKVIMSNNSYGKMKGIVDLYAEDEETANIIDYKTYREDFFSSAIKIHDLLYQASFYANLLSLSDVTDKTLSQIHFFFIAISKKWRSVGIIEVPGETLATIFNSNFYYPMSMDQWGNHIKVTTNPGVGYSSVKNPSIINLLKSFKEWQDNSRSVSGSLVTS